MRFTNMPIRRLVCAAALALTALAAFGGGAAEGSPANICTARAQACMADGEFRALMIRSEGLNRKYGLGTN